MPVPDLVRPAEPSMVAVTARSWPAAGVMIPSAAPNLRVPSRMADWPGELAAAARRAPEVTVSALLLRFRVVSGVAIFRELTLTLVSRVPPAETTTLASVLLGPPA